MPRKADGNERTGKSKKTIKKRKDSLKKKFIDKIQETPVIQVAAAQTGIDRSTYYRWVQEDRKFKKESHEALERGTEFINDMMESILIKNAKNDKLTAVIFWLKNHSPQYNDKRYHEHHITKEYVLSDERKEAISLCMDAWNQPDDGDERDDDYELPNEELAKLSPKPEQKEDLPVTKKKTKPVKRKLTRKAVVKNSSRSKIVTGVAKKLTPKKLKE
jgi:hypothetical protein